MPPSQPVLANSPPDHVDVSVDRRQLEITLDTGRTVDLDAARLRAACRCAHCVRARIDNAFPSTFESVTIDRLVPMGHYGLNIAFSDGHARGIFPWSYLATLEPTEQVARAHPDR